MVVLLHVLLYWDRRKTCVKLELDLMKKDSYGINLKNHAKLLKLEIIVIHSCAMNIPEINTLDLPNLTNETVYN